MAIKQSYKKNKSVRGMAIPLDTKSIKEMMNYLRNAAGRITPVWAKPKAVDPISAKYNLPQIPKSAIKTPAPKDSAIEFFIPYGGLLMSAARNAFGQWFKPQTVSQNSTTIAKPNVKEDIFKKYNLPPLPSEAIKAPTPVAAPQASAPTSKVKTSLLQVAVQVVKRGVAAVGALLPLRLLGACVNAFVAHFPRTRKRRVIAAAPKAAKNSPYRSRGGSGGDSRYRHASRSQPQPAQAAKTEAAKKRTWSKWSAEQYKNVTWVLKSVVALKNGAFALAVGFIMGSVTWVAGQLSLHEDNVVQTHKKGVASESADVTTTEIKLVKPVVSPDLAALSPLLPKQANNKNAGLLRKLGNDVTGNAESSEKLSPEQLLIQIRINEDRTALHRAKMEVELRTLANESSTAKMKIAERRIRGLVPTAS